MATNLPPEPLVLSEDAAISNQRARELYKYYVPPGSCYGCARFSTPDTTLTAFAQLAAWRTDSQRAMVSLIDRDMQHFVAESTKTLNLKNNLVFEQPDDAIWAGCVTVPKSGRLCEHTIAALPPQDGGPTFFEVNDLTKDPRFASLPFVIGQPYFKYYCGVPIRTRTGVNIGSFFVLDTKPREHMSDALIDFLATMADNCLTYLESFQEKEDRKRVLNMNLCLSEYVDPARTPKREKRSKRDTTTGAQQNAPNGAARPDGSLSSNRSPATPTRTSSRVRENDLRSDVSSGSYSSASDCDEMPDVPNRTSQASQSRRAFRRAAKLLLDALSLERGGGVIFLDPSNSTKMAGSQSRRSKRSKQISTESLNDLDKQGSVSLRSRKRASYDRDSSTSTKLEKLSSDQATVLASAFAADSSGNAITPPSRIPFSETELERFLRKHPNGKLFDLSSGHASSSDSDPPEAERAMTGSTISRVTSSSKSEVAILLRLFPEARQIIFIPVWNPATERHSAFFAVNTSDYRSLANHPDFLYTLAFCKCLTVDLGRIAALAADQQKADFISSISHEMRTPLHGILGACEFLADTKLETGFQAMLVSTADSCARTLLDVINLVLDYSKINVFDQRSMDFKESKSLQNQKDASPQLATLQSSLELVKEVDLSAVVEEVVEGLCAGHAYESLFREKHTSFGFDNNSQADDCVKTIDIVVDLDAGVDTGGWKFLTQPGAIRRILMNLLGNSLKYTSQGYIKVQLTAEAAQPITDADSTTTMIKLTVSDTGQGMSPHFVRTKLFVPFSQEDTLSSGIGLGLSLVKALVTVLNGQIEVSSVQGEGTQVIVLLPMQHSTAAASPPTVVHSNAPTAEPLISDALIADVRRIASTRTAAVWPFQPPSDITELRQQLRPVVGKYLAEWYGFKMITQPGGPMPDVILTNEAVMDDLRERNPGLLQGNGPHVICLCSATRWSANKAHHLESNNLSWITYPFGPFKLAQVIKQCFAKQQDLRLERDLGFKPFTLNDQASYGQDLAPNIIRQLDELHFGPSDDIISSHAKALSASQPAKPSSTAPSRSASRARSEDSATGANLKTDSSSTNLHKKPRQASKGVSDRILTIGSAESAHHFSSLNPNRVTSTPLPKPPVSLSPATPNTADTAKAEAKSPNLLLVDDNDINLRLLQTFMKKYPHRDLRLARDGQQAVDAFKCCLALDPPQPPDIIWMDLTMPIMDGFKATKCIRELEEKYHETLLTVKRPPRAMIVALTGLAGERDYKEAMASGIDVYMVKPARFKEVGSLMDIWVQNGGCWRTEAIESSSGESGTEALERTTSNKPSISA